MRARRMDVLAGQRAAWRVGLALVVALGLLLTGLVVTSGSALAAGPVTDTGVINTAAYKIEIPANWNGTLLLYSHGYVAPGSANPARDVGDPATGAALLAQGYALAGSAYKTTGWALADAFQDQIALLDYFNSKYGRPARTIAWGHSLGGIITAGLVQRNPDRFAGALPMCGVVGGGVAAWNQALDAAYAFKTLVAPQSNLQVVNITNPSANAQAAIGALMAAQQTPAGRARIALAAALSSTPGWYNPIAPPPASTDYAALEQNQYTWMKDVTFAFAFALRADLEARAGGNPSSNAGINYRWQLEKSGMKDTVAALYQQAGLDLNADLNTLDSAPRISADAQAVSYLSENITFNGRLSIPVLTLHTTADGLVTVENESAYSRVVNAAGSGAYLRQLFVQRAGHCTFTPAEMLTALQVLLKRINTGTWDDTSNVAALNAAATAFGPNLNILSAGGVVIPTAPAFTSFTPNAHLRPYDALGPTLAASYTTTLSPAGTDGPFGQMQATRRVSGDYQVTVRVYGLQPGSAHAMHFHRGTCAVQGGIIQPLPDLVAKRDGTATATFWLSQSQMAAVVSDATYLNVHRNASPPGPGITCGDVR